MKEKEKERVERKEERKRGGGEGRRIEKDRKGEMGFLKEGFYICR